uniref:DHHA1 domain-containing protein n=1 Tax=Leersia perrieri TaxID=77586 RepID=A0A0D9XPG0_9ORYZ
MLRRRRLLAGVTSPAAAELRRAFRSEAALEAIHAHSHPSKDAADSEGPTHLALYHYPTFAGAYAALAAHLFHRRLRRRLLLLPFSSVEPFRVGDFEDGGFQKCYLLDFIGPKNFALELSRFIPRVIAFDHRQSTLARIPHLGHCPSNLELNIDTTKSSAQATFDYFTRKLAGTKSDSDMRENLLDQEDEERVFNVLKYIEDADLRQWQLPNSKEFQTALSDERAKLNCITNPLLLQLDVCNLLSRVKSLARDRLEAAGRLIDRPFKVQLGRGLYGECLAIRADGNSKLSHEIGLELSQRSAAAGLRPIGAVVFMQRGLLKVCLRTTDNTIDTAEIAKAYGGGGKPNSSSFALRLEEFNAWTSVNS